ncbi:hypothetical protein PG911_16670 [Tenacibaculum ovolyticum]|uniref:hypothetical protein n=1 Tax=Tenacibaculum ovolyticum TaxID=104270 RepID=UPI0022F3C21A|nr:hypothetical protein [Tenacibaculum ovolyticum]WBX76238.1 hypothetical protein PG911_16670 [Tenacibaculum ovolyticum]
MKSLLEEKLINKYLDADKHIAIIKKYDFEKYINNVFEIIGDLKNKKSEKDIISVSNSILTKVNEKLKQVNSQSDKKTIKYLLSDIFNEYIKELDSKFSESFMPNLIENLKMTSLLSGYDFSELEKLLQFDYYNTLKPKKNNKRVSYSWNGELHQFDEFIKDLKDKKIIFSIKEFKMLFKNSGNAVYSGNIEKTDDLVIIFVILKEMNLITPKHTNGYFTPLFKYGIDNEGNFLFKKQPNKHHELLKRKHQNYNKIKGKHLKWINSIL